jgi:methionine-rich copper-binding protein CopC
VLSIANAVYVGPGPAVINSVTPNTGGQGVELSSVAINGINTHWLQGVTTLTFPGVLINSYVVNSPTSITASITVDITVNPGPVNVTTTTGGEVATESAAFYITQTQAELAYINPTNLMQGATSNLTITGIDTAFSAASTVTVSNNVAVNSVTYNSPTSLTANVTVAPTATLGYRTVTVNTPGTTPPAVASSSLFQVVTGPAEIAGLNPAAGGQGRSVTVQVTGSQTHFSTFTTASFGGGMSVTGISIVSNLIADVTVSIPNSTPLGTYNVTLTTGGEVATILGGFTVSTGSPLISVVNPPTGTQGITINVTLTGLFTNFVNGTSVANFGSGITVNTTTVSNSTSAVANITISPTATLGSRNVTVTTGGEVAGITGGFTVLAGVPALTSASPAMGQAGTTLNVIVDGVFTTFQQGFSSVSFGGGISVNAVIVNNTGQLTANITVASNASVGNRTVSVTTDGQTLNLNNGFSVTPGTPVITQINPNIGIDGQTENITIYGQYTSWVQGTTTANFGANITVNTVTVNNPTQLTVNITIGAGAPLGPVTVVTTTGAEVENVPGGFTIQPTVPPSPTLVSLSPGANAGGMPLNSDIVAVFSEPMKRTTLTTSTVLLYLISNPGQGYIPVTGTVTVDATGRVMTFTPASLLAVNSQYYLELQSGIQSATGIGFGNYDVSLYTTAASATASPTVIAANPPANSTVGTNVSAQLYFSGDMNQNTQTGMTLSTGGNPVAGTYGWNSSPNCCWGPGTLLTFTPTAPLAAGATYTVAWTSAMTDTAGNALTPGSFTFNTGAGPDTAYNYSGSYWNGQTNVGTNTQPQVVFSKVINPIDINTGTLLLYNNDSGKYIGGTVTVAPNGLSATFTPTVPLLPDAYYTFYQAGGDYDADGNYMYGMDAYFTTGVSSETTAPTVTFISPSNTATSAPLNTQILVKFSAPINPNILNVITVTPSGLPPIAGTASLASDSVTLTFVPTVQLAGGKTYTVEVSGFQDLAGNVGTLFSSTFTTATSAVAISVSTGFNAGGQLITTPGTADANWTVQPTGPAGGPTSDEALGLFAATTTSTPPCVLSGAVCESPQPLYIVGPGIGGWYGGWPANGPQSDWINMYPTSEPSNTFGVYSTRFTIPNPVPSNLCLVGAMGIDDNGELGINGTAITGNISTVGSPLSPINIPISSYLVVGSNTLSLAWGGTDNNYEAFRLQAEIETCGSSVTGGLSISSSTPSNNATAVATSTTITMNFNNTVDPATVNTTTLPVMIGWNSNQEVTGNYVVTGNQVVFTPATPFPTSTQIYVGACGGPLDLAGDSAGNCYTQLLTFQTGTTATAAPDALQVAAFSPASGATNVGLRSPVTATFNRSINLGTLNTSDWALFSGDGQSPWCTGYTHSQDDASVSFNCYPLPSSDPMTAILSSGIQDWQGNALTPLTTSFTTSPYDSNTNGSIISVRPGNGASGVNPNLPLVLYSNLPINASTANNGLEVAQNNVLDPGTIQVLDNGYTLEFTPSAPFTPGALIQWWTLSTLSETTYNTPVNADSGYFYVAASTSTLAPTIQATSPSNGDNPAPLNVHFDTQFNTPLNPSTVINANIYLYDGTNGTYPAITITQPQPNEVLVVPNANLTPNHYIYLYFTNGLQSTTSVPSNSPNWYVYTGTAADTTTPTVVSAVPYSGATNVGVNVSPGVVFSKSIDPVSLNSSTFQVLNGGTPLAGTYWFSSSDTRIEFVPNAPLPPSTTLTININGVTDWEGHSVTYNSSFQTGPGPDFITPTVVFTSIPNYGSIPTNGMMTVQFSESMDVTSFTAGGPAGCGNFYLQDQLSGDGIGCIPVTLTWNASQTVAYLVPNSPLAAGRTYVFYVYGGTDLAGNAMTAVYYTIYADATAETAAPTVIAFNPIGGKTGLGTNAIIEAQFSAPIDPNTISGVTLTNGGSPVTTTVSAFAGDTIVQLTPAVPLTPETTYTMNIIGVKDPSGNTVATVTNSFTTGTTYDITAPAVTLSDPVNYASVGTNVIPKFVFNKPLNPIYVSTGSFRIYLVDSGQFIPTTVTLSASGLEVTLTPQIPLLPNTEYEFSGGWDSGPQDQNGNFVNLPYYYFYTNGGADTTAPTVTVNPLNNATGIPLNAQVKATLSVPMDPTSWTQNSIQLLNGSTPVAGTVSYTNSTTLTFVPTANLTAGVTYTVKVSGFTDSNGNTVATSSTTFTAGTAASTSGLTVVSVSPGYGTTGNSNTSTITIVFSQVLDPNTVNSATLKVMNGWNSNDPIAGTYAVTGNTVVFTPSSAYPPGTNVTVGECGGPTDVLGDVFQNGGCYYSEFESFTVSSANPGTGSDNPFTVLSVSPASGATNVGRDQPVSVTFSNSIAQNSGNGYNSQLYAAQTLQNYGSYTLSSDNRTFTFNEGALYNGTTYTIYFPAGGISDQWGNTLASPFTSTFSTVADPTTVIPTVIGMSPGTSTSSSVPVNSLLTLYLSHQVNPATLTGNVTVTVNGQVYAGNVQADASGYQVQYTPTVAFPNSATVQWFFSGNVEDIYGNYFTGTSGYFYTVPTPVNPATAQPTLVTVSPDQGSSLMPTNGEIDLQFSQPLNAATVTTGNFFQNAGTAIAYTVSLISPTVVRISPPAGGWIPSYSYYGFCNNNSVMGTNGVAAASNCWDTYFFTTAGPNTTGGTVNIGPPNNSQNVGTNAYIRLNFSEPADRTTVNSTNVQVKIGSNPVQGSFTYNYSGDDMVGANFYPTNPLPTGSTVTVAVSNLLDYAGNEFNEPSISFQVGSAPDYTTPTAALDFNNGQSGVATNASFNCHYSEPMDPSSINSGNTFVWSYLANAIVPSTITVSADMMTATITPNAPLFQNTQYYYACYNALDLTGNAMSNTNAYFYTGSNTVSAGPVLLYANPPSGMTNVPIDTNQGPYNSTSLNLLFNEPVATESLGNITLSYVPVAEPLNTPVSVPIGAYANDGNYIVAVALPYALLPNMIYTYNVAGVTDLNGIPTASTTSSFTTGTGYDFTNAGVTATNPVSSLPSSTVLTGVPASVTVTFSEALDPVLINTNEVYLRTHNTQTYVPATIGISSSATPSVGTTITLTPITPLLDTTIYDIYYYANPWWMTDIAGNGAYENTGILTTFTTGTTAAVNGVCGTANTGTFSSPPTTNLCSTGTVSGQTNNGTYGWTCNGNYGGTNASCSATITPVSSCVAAPTGLQGWWTGNDTPNDSGPNAYNGTLKYGATYGLGEVKDAFNLTGNAVSTSNEFVLIGQPVPANLQITNAITLSAWIYVTSYPANNGGGAYGFILGSQSDGNYGGATIFYDGTTNNNGWANIPVGHIQFQIGDGSAWHETDTYTQVPLNQWVLITATRTANNPAQIYYNGVLQASTNLSAAWNGNISYPSSDWFAIGQEVNEDRAFNGLIDEAQIYSTALTAAQVQAIYNAGNAGVCP